MDLIVIPTYDERETVGVLLDRILARPELRAVDVLVVDDASPDGTGAVVRAHAGFAWARERGYGAVVQMDADGSHPVGAVARLLAGLAGADVVIGSRYVAGGRTEGWAAHRRLVSRVGNGYVRHVLAMPVRDATAGFRAVRADVLPVVAGPGTRSNGYCFQVETTWRAVRAGLRVVEVPITFVEREAGRSKMTTGIVLEALLRVLLWRVGETAVDVRDRGDRAVRSVRRPRAA